MSLEALARGLRSRKWSASELLSTCLEAITHRDPDVHAFTYLDIEGSFRRAESATADILGGLDAGPLAGVPFACKDTADVVGMPTGYGSAAVSPHWPSRNARVVDALTGAGGFCIGKLATTEFAAGDYQEPVPRNPWNPLHSTGGSSGGSAAAVAAGFVPITVAGDTGGSARIPAAFCGVSTLRPGHDAGHLQGVAPLSPSLDQVGWIAREPADLLRLWMTLRGIYSRPTNRKGSDSTYRIAVVSAWADVQDDVSLAMSRLVASLPDSGIVTANVVLEHGRRAAAAAWVTTYTEALAIYGPLVRRHRMQLTPSLVRKIDGAKHFDQRDCERARYVARRFCADVDEVLATADALLLPTAPLTAPRMTDSTCGSDVAIFTRPISLTDAASLSVPVGLGHANLPIGAQLVSSGQQATRLLEIATFMQEQNLVGQRTLTTGEVPDLIGPSPSRLSADSGAEEAGAASISPAASRDEAERVRDDLWNEGRYA